MELPEAVVDYSDSGLSARRCFTVESANRALVLVRRIVRDIVDQYAELMTVRDELGRLAGACGVEQKVEALRERADGLARRLRALHEELTPVGCELKDWDAGLVDFPARHDGRDVLLCWKLGEPEVAQWHELDGGFSGRQPVDESFGDTSPRSAGHGEG